MRHTDKNHRPRAIAPIVANIPAEMQELRQWVLWRYSWRDERNEWAKVPMQVNGHAAKSNDPATWSSFKDALNAWETARASFDGMGFMFTPASGYVGIDVDNCIERGDDGELRASAIAARVIELCDSYTELSPSETGVHVIVKATIARALKDAGTGIEIYNEGRYFTITGCLWSDFLPVREASDAVARIIAGIDAAKAAKATAKTNGAAPSVQVVATTDERIRKALAAQNGQSIARLFHGDTGEYSGDDSSADLALCSKLAFWSEGRADVLDAMFRQSRLYREKWDKVHSGDGRTYGQMTIDKALAGCREYYDPARRNMPPVSAAQEPSPEDAYAERKARRFKFGEMYERADLFRKQPMTQGEFPGWWNVNDLYRPRKGLFTVITGIPSHGKSSWLNALCLNLALRSDWKFLFCSFETQPIEQHACDLARIIIGKPSFAQIDGAASDDEFKRAFDEYGDRFQFAHVPDDEMTVEGVLSYATDAVRDDQIDGFVFDPWSELNPPTRLAGNYTQFVQQGLNKIRRHAREHNIHTWLVAHPAKFLVKGQKNGVPTLYDVADSAHFYNKADYGVVVHRPDDESSDVHIHVQKVRHYATGKKGICALSYDVTSGRYDEIPYKQKGNSYEF